VLACVYWYVWGRVIYVDVGVFMDGLVCVGLCVLVCVGSCDLCECGCFYGWVSVCWLLCTGMCGFV
jgi:hypothetical protein